ncbi:uncharacterized protein LOC132630578 isoform X2 [Lycium barbarum]|uniref:uncharacterized protein LOC132630578 isoform X2 n=1 Tax=Lycium barbarum TaxID=112863 RepID=UPI00293E7494|nr:uncharacterized protein LOC132630578 isoform X2 [Lycium barbarum]
MYAETEHDRDDMFIINLNGKELHFGIREFAIVTGLKCGIDSEFVSDPDSPNRLMDMYFNGQTKVPKNDLIELFHDKKKKEIGDADAFKIAILYFINTFLFSTESNRAFVPKLHFDLVESGEYMNYPWGNDCFKALLSLVSHKLANDPTYYRFEGFPLAIQVWFYECCSKVDPTVATRIGNHFPRIFNWRTTSQRVYFSHLKKVMFKKYSNQLVFTNILPTDEEKVAINFMEFPEETAVKHVLEPQGPTQLSPSVRGSEFDALKKEVANVRKDLKSFEKKVGEQFVDMKDYMDKSIMNLLKDLKSMFGRQTETPEAKMSGSVKDVTKEPKTSNKNDGLQHNLYFHFDEPIGDFDIGGQDVSEQISNHMVVDASAFKNGINASIPEHNLDDVVAGIDKLGALGNSATKTPTLDDFEMPPFTESQIVAIETKGGDIVTPEQQARNRNPGPYGKSPYTDFSSGGSSTINSPTYFHIKHPFTNCIGFDVDNDLITEFKDWVKSKMSTRHGRESVFSKKANKIVNAFNMGVDTVDKMEWFHTILTTGKCWQDSIRCLEPINCLTMIFDFHSV